MYSDAAFIAALENVQFDVAAWRENKYPECHIDTIFRKFGEEVGELAKAIGRRELDLQNVKDELADCAILLMGMAHQYKVSLGEAILDKWRLVKAGKRREG